MRLEGKTALVTGGGKGIGRAIAVTFARHGSRVAISGRSRDAIEDAAREIASLGGEALPVQADVSSEDDVASMTDSAIQRFGHVDILVNNAAINLPPIDVIDISPDQWRSIIDVNLTGTFLCARALLPHMMARRTGKIINISSIGGRKGAKGRGPYRASKAALINLTETLAAEVRDYGIDVNCICPGAVDTEMIQQISRGHAQDNLMHPEEIANVALFLASDESSSITGAVIDAFGQSNPLFR